MTRYDVSGIDVDTTFDALFDEYGLKRLRDSYMTPDEKSPQERFAKVCVRVATDAEHARRLYSYLSRHWLSLSTPILAFGKTKHGLPISCYLSYLADTSEGLLTTLTEVNTLSMLGGGVGIGVNIRSSDGKSTGVMPHMNTYDASCLAYKQDGVRRGAYAVYLRLDHPDIVQFIDMRKVTGDHNVRCPNLHHGVVVPDSFMRIVERCLTGGPKEDDAWPLIDPHTRETKKIVSARQLWQRLLETRLRTGEPYICFVDACNRALPESQRRRGLMISQSNLCSEIVLPTDEYRTAVCCLSSLNLERYDEWREDSRFVVDVAEMLDNALQIFIETAPEGARRAVYSAGRERSIGIGVLGWHALLQSRGIAMEDEAAFALNRAVFAALKERVDWANAELGSRRGEAPDAVGTGRRFCCATAIAPTATTSIILGNTSPSVEPFRANAYRQDTLSGSFLNKNRYLKALLDTRLPTATIERAWLDIIERGGSVQHLDCLTAHEKRVFRTAFEIDQRALVRLAAERQPYIDQAQSLNLFIPPRVSICLLHSLHFDAWKSGLKTLYYCRSTKAVETDTLKPAEAKSSCSEVTSECVACQ